MTTQEMELPRRDTQFASTDAGVRVVLKHDCLISPRGLRLVFAPQA